MSFTSTRQHVFFSFIPRKLNKYRKMQFSASHWDEICDSEIVYSINGLVIIWMRMHVYETFGWLIVWFAIPLQKYDVVFPIIFFNLKRFWIILDISFRIISTSQEKKIYSTSTWKLRQLALYLNDSLISSLLHSDSLAIPLYLYFLIYISFTCNEISFCKLRRTGSKTSWA